MKEKFKKYLKNSIPWYEYINNAKYILMWASEDGNIHYSTATTDYVDLLDFPRSEKEYQNPEEVLAEEMNDNNAIFGIIFENQNNKGNFKIIAKRSSKQNLKSWLICQLFFARMMSYFVRTLKQSEKQP